MAAQLCGCHPNGRCIRFGKLFGRHVDALEALLVFRHIVCHLTGWCRGLFDEGFPGKNNNIAALAIAVQVQRYLRIGLDMLEFEVPERL